MGKKATNKKSAPDRAKAPKKPARPQRWNEREVSEAFSRFEKANPHPKGELEYVNHFTLLVAVVLSAQTTDVGGKQAAPRALFAVGPHPGKAMAALGEERIARLYQDSIGLYKGQGEERNRRSGERC
jgi:endonuclease-3